MRRTRRLLALALVLVAPDARADEDYFEVAEIPAPGRTLVAEMTDANGDGRTDLVLIAADGLPPEETRTIRVHLQSESGALLSAPTFEAPLPPGGAAYDLAELDGAPGTELVLLQRDGASIVSLSNPASERRTLHLLRSATVAAGTDERGLEPIPLVFDDFGPTPWLLLPLLGELAMLSPQGETLATLAIGGRANYFVPPRSALYALESDLQLFYDAPVVSVGDVDGDGRADVVSCTRHEIRVFLRKPEGTFSHEPDRAISLGLVQEQDHIRGTGGVAVVPRDIDADGRLDLLVSAVTGGFTEATTRTNFHLNRNGGWDLARPDRTFDSQKRLGSNMLFDVDGDGRFELLRGYIDIGVLEIVEFLLTRSIDGHLSIHRYQEEGVFEDKPWVKKKVGVAVDFETFRTKGFLPTLHGDLNADGFQDLLIGGEGEKLEVMLGRAEKPYSKRDARQKLDTRGQLRFGDWNGDGLTDLLLFDPQHPGTAVRLAVNLGRLPGTTPSLRATEER